MMKPLLVCEFIVSATTAQKPFNLWVAESIHYNTWCFENMRVNEVQQSQNPILSQKYISKMKVFAFKEYGFVLWKLDRKYKCWIVFFASLNLPRGVFNKYLF